jgi:hypothetical protein
LRTHSDDRKKKNQETHDSNLDESTSVHYLHATMLHCHGFDQEQLTFRYGAGTFRLTDMHGDVINSPYLRMIEKRTSRPHVRKCHRFSHERARELRESQVW